MNEQKAKSWEREALVMCCLIRFVLYILYLYIFSKPQGMLKLHSNLLNSLPIKVNYHQPQNIVSLHLNEAALYRTYFAFTITMEHNNN